MASASTDQLKSQPRTLFFSPHGRAKTNDKSTFLRENGT